MVTAASSTIPQELDQNPTNPRPPNHRRPSPLQLQSSTKSKMDQHSPLQHSHQSLSKFQPTSLRPPPLHPHALAPRQPQRPHLPFNHQIRRRFFTFSGQTDSRPRCQDWRSERPVCADLVRWLLLGGWGIE